MIPSICNQHEKCSNGGEHTIVFTRRVTVEKPEGGELFKTTYFKAGKQGSAPFSQRVEFANIDNMVKGEDWLYQEDDVCDKLSVQHPVSHDAYNLCD